MLSLIMKVIVLCHQLKPNIMKSVILLGLLSLLFVSCQNDSRYTQNSPEIEVVKQTLQDYDYQNWDEIASHYADTAKIYHNSRVNILTPEDLPEYFQEMM